jgi:hypothetical protein
MVKIFVFIYFIIDNESSMQKKLKQCNVILNSFYLGVASVMSLILLCFVWYVEGSDTDIALGSPFTFATTLEQALAVGADSTQCLE